jgi:hypothetical protein
LNPDTHKLPGRFCPADPECDYEVRPGADQPAPLIQAENVERVLKNKQREHSLMLKRAADVAWIAILARMPDHDETESFNHASHE